jgi:hypothetical protein
MRCYLAASQTAEEELELLISLRHDVKLKVCVNEQCFGFKIDRYYRASGVCMF